jgi:hypothetical protein
MSRDLNKEVETLREKLTKCIKENKITDKLFTNLILSMIWLHFLADQEGATKNPNERRRIICEFKRGKKALEEEMGYVSEQRPRGITEPAELHAQRHLP